MAHYNQPFSTGAMNPSMPEIELEQHDSDQHKLLYSHFHNQDHHDNTAFKPDEAQIQVLPSQFAGNDTAQYHGLMDEHNTMEVDAPWTAPRHLPFPSELITAIPSTRWQDTTLRGSGPTYISDEVLFRVSSVQSVHGQESVLGGSGRLYHGYKQDKNFIPNDAQRQDRIDTMHTSFRLLLEGKLALAPFSTPPEYVLDIGSGTGIWAIEFAKEHPGAYVIGTDISAFKPTTSALNCTFLKDDVEDDWMFPVPDNKFDYVHLRFMVSCFDDPRKVMTSAFNNLNPGGWIEYQDSIMPFLDLYGGAEGTAMQKWNDALELGVAAMGRDLRRGSRYKEWLLETGFVDVVEKKLQWPAAPWPTDARLKRAGHYMSRSFQDGLRGVSWNLLGASGLSPPEIEQLVSDAMAELLDNRYGWYINVYIVYGRKPFEGEL